MNACPFCGGKSFQPVHVSASDKPRVKDPVTRRMRHAHRCRAMCHTCKGMGPLKDDYEDALDAMKTMRAT